MRRNKNGVIVIKLGGSLIIPDDKGLDIEYIKNFYKFIRHQVSQKKRRFFILIGGGFLSRIYRDTGAEITGKKLTNEDLDWLGIHVTRLNAHLFRTIFRDLAHETIIKDYDFIQKPQRPIVIAAGWKPGWSTDYDAVLLAQDYNIKTIIKMGNTDFIYNKDPRKFKNASPFKKITWKKYRHIIGSEWIPGSHAPIDPIAAKLADELQTKVLFLNGKNFKNVARAIEGKNFLGTVIE